MALVDTGAGSEERLVTEALGPVTDSVIRPVVRRKLHVSLRADDTGLLNQDALELVAEVQVVLVGELQRRSEGNGHDIRDLAGFAATVTSNACYQYLRSRFPVRTQQKNKLRYILSHHRSFAVWRDEEGRWLCGRSHIKDNGKRPRPIVADISQAPPIEPGSSERRIYESIIESAFDASDNSPVLLDELVQYVMQVRGLKERVEINDTGEDDRGIEATLSDPRPGADSVLESFARLKHLWCEIRKLPLQHRKALLLNLKDSGGDGLIAVLPLSGVASMREIAAALEMPAEELAAIWNSLPWDDLKIAGHLGLTRQQVINLRQTARLRLTRACR